MLKFCPVCATEVKEYFFDHPNGARVECPVCGTYRIMERAVYQLSLHRQYTPSHAIVPNRRLSAAIRELVERGQEPVVTDPNALQDEYCPAGDLVEVLDRILLHLRRRQSAGHAFVPLIGHRDHGVAGSLDPQEFEHALGEALALGYVERKAPSEAAYRLTINGVRYLKERPAVERQTLLSLADRALKWLYDHQTDGVVSPAGLVDALSINESEVERVVRYLIRQEWASAEDRVFGRRLPHRLELTAEGMRRAEDLLSLRPAPAAPQTVIYNLHGPNPRVNVSSHDHSVNVVNVEADDLFVRIEAAVRTQVPGVALQAELLDALNGLRTARDQRSRTEKLGKLLEVGADAVTVLQPFMPALMQLAAQG